MKRSEQWQDTLARLYPEIHGKTTGDRILSRTITFQVTDACNLACFPASTKILMADYTYKNIEDIQVGDMVMGFDEETEKGKQNKLYPTVVTHLFNRHDKLLKITDKNGGQIFTTKNHPFLDGRGNWKRAEEFSSKHKVCKFFDIGLLKDDIADLSSKDYMIGYTVAAWLGDGHIAKFKHGVYYPEKKETQSRFAQKDMEIIYRMQSYLNAFDIEYHIRPFKISKKERLYNDAIYLDKESSEKLRDLILNNLNINDSYNYLCGFLAGIYDTEGHFDKNSNYIRIFNANDDILTQCETALQILGYDFIFDKERQSSNCTLKTIRIMNPRNTNTILKLLMTIQPAIKRKGIVNFYNKPLYERVDIDKVEFFDGYHDVYNFETEAHTYIANNYLVHNCSYCYQINKGTRHMKFETAKKFIDMLLNGDKRLGGYVDVKTSPGIIIEFIGGEPFLEVELIDKICDYFYDTAIELEHPWAEKFCISICSNGVLGMSPKVQAFINKWERHLSYSITIDGNKELHDSCRVFEDGSGSYDLAVRAAKDWIDRGGYMGSKITIAPANLPYMKDAILHMIELGYDEINANVVYEEGWTVEHARDYYKQLKEIADYWIDNNLVETHYLALFDDAFFVPMDETDNDNWCGGVNSLMLSIDPDGYLYPCIRYMESSLGSDMEPVRIGDVDTGIAQCESCRKCLDMVSNITRRSQSTDECFNCPIANGCSWCFKAGTLITTPDGFKPIEEIQVGDKVISGNGNVKSVEKINKRYTDDTIEIKAAGMRPIYTTSEHPFLVRNFHRSGNNLIYDEPEWKKASEIKKSDRIALFVNKFGNIHINENVAYVAGRYLGDGMRADITEGNQATVGYLLRCSRKESEELEGKLSSACIRYHKDKVSQTTQQYLIYETGHDADDNNELLASIISKSGEEALNSIFNWDKESIYAFLCGYFDAVGSYSRKRETAKFAIADEKTAQNISSLMLMFGKKMSWCVKNNSSKDAQKDGMKARNVYELSCLTREPKRRYYEFDEDNGIMWVNVKSVNSDIDGYEVYNMSVADDHTFIANGVIVHNCSAYNYQVSGSVNHRVTYICEMHKARSLANVYFWNKYYRNIDSDKHFPLYCPDEWALNIISQDELDMLKTLASEE